MAMKSLQALMSTLILALVSTLTMSSISYGMKDNSMPVSGLFPDDPVITLATNNPDWNVLEIKGQFIGGYEAEINVYSYIDSLDKWVNIYSLEEKKDYSIRLNPEEDYQVWFLSPGGGTKILCIESGNFGTYSLSYNIDFSISSKLFSVLYQDDESCRYVMSSCKGCFIDFDTHPVDNIELSVINNEH